MRLAMFILQGAVTVGRAMPTMSDVARPCIYNYNAARGNETTYPAYVVYRTYRLDIARYSASSLT
jgi:hypothetical protein